VSDLDVDESKRALLRAVKEKDFQAQVIELAQRLGWLAYHFRSVLVERKDGSKYWATPIEGDKGFVDVVFVRDRVLFAELKSETGRLSQEQAECIARLGRGGAEAYVWRPSNWPAIEIILR